MRFPVTTWVGSVLIMAMPAAAADVILSEYNAVGSTWWLGNPDLPECQGPTGFDCDGSEDVFFGRVMGNGGNWIELTVITDHLDMRGWRLFWEQVLDLEQGTIFLSNHPFWGDLRAGTIITITELTTAQGGLDSDVSFDPCLGDWWVNVNSFDTTYVTTTTTNVPGDGPGNFSVGNSDWRLTIRDDADQVVYGPAGEGSLAYTGSGVNDREICRLEADPSAGVTPGHPYDDGTHSTFGSFNRWTDAFTCDVHQDYGPVRQGPLPEFACCTRLVLNGYNGVDDLMYLNGGDQLMDEDGGQAADSFFGRVLANGGDWVEFIVVKDHLDVRGWTLDWEELGLGTAGTITLSNDTFWSDLPAGLLLTFIEWTTAQGGLDTDTGHDVAQGDRWVNINTFDTQYVSGTTSNIAGHVSGEFDVSSKDSVWTIKDASSAVVQGPVGEGSIYYYQDGVNDRNVFRLEEDPSGAVNAVSEYDDGASSSSFGAPNEWTVCPNPAVITQSFSGLPDPDCGDAPACPSDLDGSGAVGTADLLILLGAWGPNPGHPADFNGDGTVGTADLLQLLGDWGPC